MLLVLPSGSTMLSLPALRVASCAHFGRWSLQYSLAAAHPALLRSAQQPAWQALPAQHPAECSARAAAGICLPVNQLAMTLVSAPAAATPTRALRLLRGRSGGVLLMVPWHRCDACSALTSPDESSCCWGTSACYVLAWQNLVGTRGSMA